MKTFPRKNLLCVILVGAVVAGCANVSPTQRGTLARPDMQWDADVAQVKLSEHTYASKEAASGGRATGGGGCGCT
jgi:autotransporter translocation and assembly factor TamB